jgi:hypothetical protein
MAAMHGGHMAWLAKTEVFEQLYCQNYIKNI